MGEKVIVTDANRNSKLLHIDMGETFATFKAMYLEKYSVDLNDFRLTCGGRNLEGAIDDQTLTSLGIKNGSKILAISRLQGGF